MAAIVSQNEEAISKQTNGFVRLLDVVNPARSEDNIKILIGLQRKYPELRLLTASIIVQTSNFDLQTLSFKKFEAPQNMNFLDYIMHVLDSPQQMELVTSFFEVDSTPFPLLDPKTKREMTSHEYFRARIIERAFYGLQMLSDSKSTQEAVLSSRYMLTIDKAIDARYYWTPYEEALVNNTILRLEESMVQRPEKKISLNQQDMPNLNSLFQSLLRLNAYDAFIRLDPIMAEPISYYPERVFRCPPENMLAYVAIQHFTRDYESFDSYSKAARQPDWILLGGCKELSDNNGVQATDIELSRLQELASKLDIDAIREETDSDRKAVLIQAVLEQKPLDIEYQITCIESPYSHFMPEPRIKNSPFSLRASLFTRVVRIREQTRLQ